MSTTTCAVCGQPGRNGIGSTLLCAEHASDARLWIDEQRATKQPVDVSRWAARARADLKTQTLLRLSPQARAALESLAEARGLSLTATIEALILAAK